MSDISTADTSADVVTEAPSEGLDTSTPIFEAEGTESFVPSDEGVVETEAVAPEPLFEIDGTPVTLEEARNSYLRQSDYTRKTQELAQQRQELAQAEAISAALQADPVATLEALAEAFGVNVQAAPSNPFEGLDPEQTRLAQLEATVARQEAASRQAAVEAEINQLTQTYGDVDVQSVIAHTVKNGFPNLASAYKDMQFDAVQAQLAEQQRVASAEAARVEAKRAAQVAQGGTATSSGSVAPAPVQTNTVREAYLAAKKMLGA